MTMHGITPGFPLPDTTWRRDRGRGLDDPWATSTSNVILTSSVILSEAKDLLLSFPRRTHSPERTRFFTSPFVPQGKLRMTEEGKE